MDEERRAKVRRAVQKHGGAAVARAFGTSRNSVLSYCAETSNDGTTMLMEHGVDAGRLDALPSDAPKKSAG